jgi:flagellar biosynthesis protein FlhB
LAAADWQHAAITGLAIGAAMADDQDQDQKTEEPTGKRLDEAREKGQLPISREVGHWFMFFGIVVTLVMLTPAVAKHVTDSLRVFFEMAAQIRVEDRGLQNVLGGVLVEISFATIVLFMLLIGVALLGTIVQTGFFAATEQLAPDMNRVSPMAGLKRIFSATALFELFKSLVKILVIGAVAYAVLMPFFKTMELYIGKDMLSVIQVINSETIRLILVLMVVITIIAVVDFFYQRYQYIKSLRMTKAEVKDEYKQSEGDPMIKMRLRQIRMEKTRKRMMAQVPKADVIITNPTHYAIALQYTPGKQAAPVVLAKGIDLIAERIRNVAKEHDIPLVANPPLARVLYKTVEVDQEIPTQHYRAVAEIISYVYKIKRKKI